MSEIVRERVSRTNEGHVCGKREMSAKIATGSGGTGFAAFFFAAAFFRAAEDFLRRLDLAMGKNTRVGMTAGDVCDDGAVDDVVAKINFLKENGVNENTAKEVAALLSDGRLDKPRTREQQKRLNIALNGLLQVMSARQEKQIGARG